MESIDPLELLGVLLDHVVMGDAVFAMVVRDEAEAFAEGICDAVLVVSYLGRRERFRWIG
jgi:hypothetical protein